MADTPPISPEASSTEARSTEARSLEASSSADTGTAPGSPPAPAGAKAAEQDGPQVLGGRMIYAILMLFGMSAISAKEFNSWIDRRLNPPELKPAVVWQVGKEARLELTLVTADARRLNCAHDRVIEGQHCGFTSNKHAWPRKPGALADDNDVDVIQPYRTADTNALVLVSGVWAQPELAWRIHREPPSYYDIKKQVRFVAYCDVRFIGELEHVSLRWDTGGKWLPEGKAMVAKALRCTLDEPEG